jgi:hypothetical protein
LNSSPESLRAPCTSRSLTRQDHLVHTSFSGCHNEELSRRSCPCWRRSSSTELSSIMRSKTCFSAHFASNGKTDQQLQQTCFNNMQKLADSLGCPSATADCLCSKPDFGYGVRDCSAQSCPAGTDLDAIVAYVGSYCASSGKCSTS